MVESRTVKIPLDLFNSMQDVILKVRELQYQSPNEFIIEAIRHRIEEILQLNIFSEEKKEEVIIISDFV